MRSKTMKREQHHRILDNYQCAEGFGSKDEAKRCAARIRALGHRACVTRSGGCWNVYVKKVGTAPVPLTLGGTL